MSKIGLGGGRVLWYSVYNVVHKYISYITKKMHILLTKIGKHRHFPYFLYYCHQPTSKLLADFEILKKTDNIYSFLLV